MVWEYFFFGHLVQSDRKPICAINFSEMKNGDQLFIDVRFCESLNG